MSVEDILKALAGIVGAIGTILYGAWKLISRWGDDRWVQRTEAFDKHGDPLWASRQEVDRYETLVTGQGDNVARHQQDIETLKDKVQPLAAVVERMGRTSWDKIDTIPDRLAEFEGTLGRVEATLARLEAHHENQK